MLSSFEHEFDVAMKTLSEEEKQISRHISVATGEASYAMINAQVNKVLQQCPNMRINVYAVKNNFFGGEVTVSGLLTGVDIAEQLKDKALGSDLYLSRNVLRSEGDLFLCGMTPEELGEKLNCNIVFSENDGAEFLFNLLGI